MVNFAPLHESRNSSACSSLSNRSESSATSCFVPRSKKALTLYDDLTLKSLISRSRSTTSRTATDCTRPADKPVAIFFQRSEEHTSELQSQSNLVCRLLL